MESVSKSWYHEFISATAVTFANMFESFTNFPSMHRMSSPAQPWKREKYRLAFTQVMTKFVRVGHWVISDDIDTQCVSSLQTMASNSNMTNMRGRTYTDFQTNMSRRLMTFYPEGCGPSGSLWKCPYIYPDALVRAGFIYSGHKDRVHCVFCRKDLSQWEPGDIPRDEHIKRFPDCVGIQYEWVGKQCL